MKKIWNVTIGLFKALGRDTLMEEDSNGNRRFSRMSIMMTTAWAIVIFMALRDFSFTGLRMDVWLTFVSVAMGTKIVNAHAKKIENGSKP